MKKFALILFLIFLSSLVAASCLEEQININSASLSELDGLSGIGEVKAQSIIDSRPYNSIEDLLNAYGIGEFTLENIKDQGLACVDSERSEETYEENFNGEYSSEIIEEQTTNEAKEFEQPEIIKLSVPESSKTNSKDIKTDGNNKVLDKSDYAKYGFVVFCVLIGFLFIVKNRKNRGLV